MIFFSRNQYCYFAKQTSRLKMRRKITSRDYEKQQVFERLLQIKKKVKKTTLNQLVKMLKEFSSSSKKMFVGLPSMRFQLYYIANLQM